ncbi:AAA family ATPase [Sediminicola luteus]|uniref:ATPase n=1 Tax=Sediminicola luteus TaxID=319238 RepID=A0A2A4G818_9FLAO|nr:ATP-binding protein [Sediminicola luteus]PCE64136.1 ATPase [Sediminicola luteus]
MDTKRILLIGGPSTGKTSLIKALEEQGYPCFHEVSREVTLAAREEGIQQLFVSHPTLFSERLLQGRIKQFEAAKDMNEALVFYDRGIPDVVAYMDFANENYNQSFTQPCTDYRYDIVFMLLPWKEIYTSDNERYENFEEALRIHTYLENTYAQYEYQPIVVPFGSIAERAAFVIDHLNLK